MATRSTKQTSMCCVEIGFQSFLMTVDDGMKGMKLMQNAIECERTYSRDHGFIPKDEPVSLEMKIVKSSQIIARPKNNTLVLGND